MSAVLDELVRERDHYRERAATHHRRGDKARHEAAVLRRRVAALEKALDDVVPHLAVYDLRGFARCPECGQDYEPADAELLTHAKSCRVGRAVRLRRLDRR